MDRAYRAEDPLELDVTDPARPAVSASIGKLRSTTVCVYVVIARRSSSPSAVGKMRLFSYIALRSAAFAATCSLAARSWLYWFTMTNATSTA